MFDFDPQSRCILEETYSTLDEEARAFLKSRTGIDDELQLKEHVLQVQASAFAVHKYRCIHNFNFLKLKISRLPAYEQLLKLGRERKCALFLDIGCCFGNDIRKAIADGYPMENVIGSDLYDAFWELGHRLFNDGPGMLPVLFLPGDVFSPAFLNPSPPVYSSSLTPVPCLASVDAVGTLNPLLGHISAIHASSFFHLFDETHQAALAGSLAGLLSPEPGSVIFGSHGGRSKKGLRGEVATGLWRTEPMWCHDPESWKALWDGKVFRKGTVRVEAVLKEGHSRFEGAAEDGGKPGSLIWSVTRL